MPTTPMGVPQYNPVQPPDLTKEAYSKQSLYIFVDHCANLRPWQQEFTNKLANSNVDFYMLAQPGGGKTAPVVCHWVNNILGLSTNPNSQQPTNIQNLINLLTAPEKLNQVLWLAPIQALNNNLQLEFAERFVGIILQFLNKFATVYPSIGLTLPPTIGNNITIASPIREMGNKAGMEANQIAESLINMIHPPDQLSNYYYVQQNYVEAFRLQLGDLVKLYVDNCLVGIKQEKTDTHKILRTEFPKPFVLCIYESASSIIKNPHYNKLKLIVCDEAQRLQGSQDPDDISRAQQIANSMHETLMNPNTKHSQLVLLSGSTSMQTARNLMHFLNVTYGRRFKGSLLVSYDKNPSEIRVFPMTGLNDEYTQLRIIKNALAGRQLRKHGIVFIIFGKDRINRIVDTLAPSGSFSSSPRKNLSASSSNSLYGKQNVKEIMQTGQDISYISDERLRRAVSNGLGFLYRQKGEMDVQHQRDAIIVQNLFIAGKIKVLLCTDAIREGINIKASEIYIPTIKKPPNNEEMEPGGLAQLINRAGREENKSAAIYTDPRYVDKIANALSGDFQDLVNNLLNFHIRKEQIQKIPVEQVFLEN